MTEFSVQPGGSLQGEIRVPGDKSISHRSIILGSLANGVTSVSGFLEGEDSLRTLYAFRAMGVDIEYEAGSGAGAGANGGGSVRIKGVGLHGLQKPSENLDLGNSGTAMRLMTGVMAGQRFASTLVGDESLSVRPMGRIINPLAEMGAVVDSSEGQRPPLLVRGSGDNTSKLTAIRYNTPVASAQVKSCLLLAGLYAEGTTTIVEPGVTRDHTERMLRGFGIDVSSGNNTASLTGGGELTATDVLVPSDISSSAFFLVGASIAKGSDILLRDVGVNPTRDGVIEILKLMGADIDVSNKREIGGELVADIRVRSAALKGVEIPAHLVPLAIDEFPAIFIAACAADGETLVTGAEELRVKETDRIQAMVDGLDILGAQIEAFEDGARITGGKLTGGAVDSCGDHRIAMAFAMAGLIAEGPIQIADCDNVNTSFPGFAELASNVGLSISVKAQDAV